MKLSVLDQSVALAGAREADAIRDTLSLAPHCEALGYHQEDLDTIAALETRKGEYSTCLLDSEAHGRSTVRIYLSDIEYWACSADPTSSVKHRSWS